MFKALNLTSAAILLLASLCMTVQAAEPTVDQVYAAAAAGHLADAQAMMNQVLAAHPNSAKAHFIEAELLAKQGLLVKARNELATAERLKPDLSFADANARHALQAQLSAASPLAVRETVKPSFPWGLLVLGVLVIAFIAMVIRALRPRSIIPAGQLPFGANPNGYGGQPYGSGYGPTGGGPVGGMGGGILGGLATGAALGAGMVAGEALAHNLMGDSRSSEHPLQTPPDVERWDNSNDNMGGQDFGVSDSSSWDDSSSAMGDMGGGDWS